MSNDQGVRDAITEGRTALGIELGSTRIKAVLIGPDRLPIASGGHGWENQFVDRLWTYSLEAVQTGLQDRLRRTGGRRPGALRRGTDDGRRARHLGDDARLSGPRRRRRTADPVPDLAQHQHRRRGRAADRAVRLQHPAPVERGAPLPGHAQRRGARRPDQPADHPRRVRARTADRRAGARGRRCQRHVPDRHRRPAATTSGCSTGSTNSPPSVG